MTALQIKIKTPVSRFLHNYVWPIVFLGCYNPIGIDIE